MADDLRERLAERGVTLELTDAGAAALVKEGYDPAYGARPLRRVIQRQVENPLSRRVLAGEFNEGDTVVVDHAAEGYSFTRKVMESSAA